MNHEEIIVALLIAFGIVAVAFVQLRRHRLRAEVAAKKAQMVARLSERFGSDAEFIAFLQTPEGQLMLEGEYSSAAMGYRLIGLLQAGIVAIFIGLAFLANSFPPPTGADINLVREADFARWWGIVLLGVGTGLIVAGSMSAKIAKRWGVLGR
ncbi:hypothetical protein [Arenimonas sp.]|uniref:hypothetical protein n=1 Tax=Arenimonas sp. TaxID=1872635 RepID=UPI0039E5AAE3